MKKRILEKIRLVAVISVLLITITGCKDEKIEYSNDIGIVSGNIDLSGEEPKISLSNIKAYVGEEIDYLSGITVSDVEKYDEMETWVDASLVDIFTPGDYKATYTFIYGDREYTKDIVVTIIEKKETAGDESNQYTTVSGNNGNWENTTDNSQGNQVMSQNTTEVQGNSGSEYNSQVTSDITSDITSGITSGITSDAGQYTSPAIQTTTKNPGQATTNSGQGTTNNNSQTTTHRQIITSAGVKTTEYKELGYYSIELLSGKTVKLKSTTSKYIVSTHTDISYITKNNVEYKVSKLIVTFNTGDTQVLETVEEKVQ